MTNKLQAKIAAEKIHDDMFTDGMPMDTAIATAIIQSAIDAETDELEKVKDGAYLERNKLVAILCRLFPSSIERHPDEDTEWEDDWRWVVYIDLPTGQCSWHLHDSQLSMFDHVERLGGREWDGHTTEQKYDRCDAFNDIGLSIKEGDQIKDQQIAELEKKNKSLGVIRIAQVVDRGKLEDQIADLKAKNSELVERHRIALLALARIYFAHHREGWEKSETEDEAWDNVVNTVGSVLSGWPADYDVEKTDQALSAHKPNNEDGVDKYQTFDDKDIKKLKSDIQKSENQLDKECKQSSQEFGRQSKTGDDNE